jgi:hypothetical protein
MRQIKAPIAGKAQSIRSSQSIRFAHGLGPTSKASVVGLAKIGNAAMRRSELDRSGAPGPALRYFNQQMLIHELIRGSLDKQLLQCVKLKHATEDRREYTL